MRKPKSGGEADSVKDRAVEPNLNVGLTIRHARLVKGLQLQELSAKAGYSASLLSKIENGKTAPSLVTLQRVAKALDLTLIELLSQTVADGGIVSKAGTRPSVGVAAGADSNRATIRSEVIIPLGRSALLQAFIVRVDAGASVAGKRQHDGEEVGYVLSGELLLTVSETSYHLSAGDSFFFSSRLLHEFKNPGKDIAEVVWVNTPASVIS